MSGRTSSERLRVTGSRALGFAAELAHRGQRKLASKNGLALDGDRWVEWAFCLSRLADGPGRTLDFGADVGFLSLAAAERGHQVVAVDRMAPALAFRHQRVTGLQADILDRPLEGERFDQILNCSSIEHVGLTGRYGSTEAVDGDLEAMSILRDRLERDGRMILTIPVGVDQVFEPFHRIYGQERLPRLLEGYAITEQRFWVKQDAVWVESDREQALATAGSPFFYSLGLFVLADGER